MAVVLVVGTRNPKKRQELLEILDGLPIELRDLRAYPNAPEVVEDGTTFAENACKKARELAQHLREWVLGEDSGLVVPALDGRPGVYSARYAGQQGDDQANNQKLRTEVAALPEEKRVGYYVCCVALAKPDGEVILPTIEGRCSGLLLTEPRGQGGFGYDPLFLVREYHQTFGELSSRVKHVLSHRARALAQLSPVLRRLMSPQ